MGYTSWDISGVIHAIELGEKFMGYDQWEFQDPKMEVLYYIRLYFAGIFPEI